MSIKAHEIKPIKKWLKGWIARRPNAERIWKGILADYQAMRDASLAEVRRFEQVGVVSAQAWTRHAHFDIVKVAASAEPKDACLTIMATTVLAYQQPKRVVDHRAHLFQIARRFLRLSEVSVEVWDHVDGKPRRCWKSPAARLTKLIGTILLEGVGVHGFAIHNKWTTEMAQAQAWRQSARDAIARSTAIAKGEPTSTQSTFNEGELRQ